MTRYRTIMADPPWSYPGGFGTVPDRPFHKGMSHGRGPRAGTSDTTGTFVKRPIPYKTLSVDEIAALPVAHFAEDDASMEAA